jgi:hypothetical protein
MKAPSSAKMVAGLCWRCGYDGSTVSDSRPHDVGRFRRRKCLRCEARWATVEVPISRDERGHTAHALADELAGAVAALKMVSDLLVAMQGLVPAVPDQPDDVGPDLYD